MDGKFNKKNRDAVMNTNKKYVLFILLIISLGGYLLYNKYTGDFRLSNITYSTPFNPEWATTPLASDDKKDLLSKLQQHYKFIGKGDQIYAFVSEDGNYVIKFFQFKHLKPSSLDPFFSYLPQMKKYLDDGAKRKQHKIDRLFNSHWIAYKFNRENSGLVYVHLNKTDNELKTTLQVSDRLGIKHSIDLDNTVFVLQKKGTPSREYISPFLSKGNTDEAKYLFRQLIDLYLSEYEKGIYDLDHNLMYNTGFIDGRPARLDVGKMILDERIKDPRFYKKDLENVAWKRIDKWMEKYFPQQRIAIANDLHQKLEEIFPE
ncbi:MAG: hypothetical protein H0X46_07860 [Bacteroidetes bacterium]|nr:hypothetical protein [Bacteroidota bacterium]